MANPTVVAVLGVVIALAGLIYTVAAARKNSTAQLADRLARLETKVEIFWRGVSFNAAQALHSPHPEFARRDELLEGFMAGALNGPDMSELVRVLTAVREDHQAPTAERLAAGVLLSAIEAQFAQ